MAAATLLAAYWLWRFPSQIGSDDALFFSHGITHFSVLEFSPHFPGYPGFIWLARLFSPLTDTATDALVTLTRCAALLLPWASYALIRAAGHPPGSALVGFLLLLTEPLLLGLGLQGLSDGPALLLICLALWSVLARQGFVSGLLFGLCLAIRPSYAPMLLPLLIWLFWSQPQIRMPSAVGLLMIAFAAALFVFSQDGLGYFLEGKRFIEGHFQLWGNSALTASQSQTWQSSITHYLLPTTAFRTHWPLLIIVLTMGVFATLRLKRLLPLSIQATGLSNGEKKPSPRAWQLILILLISGTLWTLGAQNPDNLRHLAPLLWALSVLLAFLISRLRPVAALSMALMLLSFNALQMVDKLNWQPSLAPVQQLVETLRPLATAQPTPLLLATNIGVETIRAELSEVAVLDSYYPGTIERVLQRGGFRLSTTALLSSELPNTELLSSELPNTEPLNTERSSTGDAAAETGKLIVGPLPELNPTPGLIQLTHFRARVPGERSLWLYRKGP